MLNIMLVHGIRNRKEQSLEQIIDKYTAYVCTVARNAVGSGLTHEDVEEIASDTFLSLWENANKMRGENLKSYLGAIARNKAVNKLRKRADSFPLDETIAVSDYDGSLEDKVISEEEQKAMKRAVLAMQSPDREIFLRYYYNTETVATIAAHMGLTEAAVKHRLIRGREKLRQTIIKEGYAL
jgi:RNA polymerase sigma-70 factor (ECF subfamily)